MSVPVFDDLPEDVRALGVTYSDLPRPGGTLDLADGRRIIGTRGGWGILGPKKEQPVTNAPPDPPPSRYDAYLDGIVAGVIERRRYFGDAPYLATRYEDLPAQDPHSY